MKYFSLMSYLKQKYSHFFLLIVAGIKKMYNFASAIERDS